MKTKSTLFFFAFVLWVNINTVNAQVNVQDSLVLVDLYKSTNGPSWVEQTNWLTINPVSTWFGITVTGTRVTGIAFSENGMNGTIPSSIGNLTKLTVLSMVYNDLKG